MKTKTLILPVILAGLLAACGSTQVDPMNPATPNPSLTGPYRVLSNDVFELPGEARYLSFTPTETEGAGSAELLTADATGVLGCVDLVWARFSENTLAVSFPSSIGEEVQGSALLLLTEWRDTQLVLRDEWGAEIVLAPVDEVPSASRCSVADITTRVATNVRTAFRGGLIFDGTRLWTNAEGLPGAVTLNPDTGTMGEESVPVGGDASWVHAVEGGAFWGFCGCGHNQRVALADNQFTAIDEIDTDADFDSKIHVDAIAKNGTTLLLMGRGANGGKLLRVNAQPEPDVLLEVIELDEGRKSGMTVHDGDLWYITWTLGQVLVRFDLDTNRAIQTFQLPDDSYWHGLAHDGESLLVLRRYDESSELVEISNL